MARLNDPPQPVGESLDALKRRFVRQNRELARVNSTQSVRIRNLESEVSSLLGENVSLREQIIKLHYALDNDSGRAGWDKVGGLKQKLESKMTELGGILEELGDIHNKAAKKRPVKLFSGDGTSPKISPNPRPWKNNVNLCDRAGEADGRLPPILEDKCFPRRTLDGNELQGIFADTGNLTDSPDLGPPSVALFQEADPIKYSGMPDSTSDQRDGNATTRLSSNQETRKKRRESFHQRDSSSQKKTIQPEGRDVASDTGAGTVPSLKTGAKRKLNVRDDDDDDQPKAAASGDDIRNVRKGPEIERETVKPRTSTQPSYAEIKIASSKSAKEQIKLERPKDTNPSGARRVLGPKSVNSDLQSPAKLGKLVSKENGPKIKEDIVNRIRERNQGRNKHASSKAQKPVTEIEVSKAVEATTVDLPPKTPVLPGLDLFSPTASDPSERRPDLRDTPPPPDLGPDTGTGSFGRSSRRSRGSVSYAEPNLRDKMRRPTKDLIDAVGAEEKLRQAAANREGPFSSVEPELDRTRIKLEEDNESHLMWKTKPLQESRSQQQRLQAEKTSPLGKKANLPAAELPASVMTERRRRTSTVARKEDDDARGNNSSGAGTVIAALSGAPYRNRHEDYDSTTTDAAVTDSAALREATDRVSIFDFTSSSPENAANLHGGQEGPAKPMRLSRRHSSVPALSDHDGKGPITVSRRRRETLLGKDDVLEKVTTKPEQTSTKDTIASKAAAAEEQGSLGRSERAASRRRSMMI